MSEQADDTKTPVSIDLDVLEREGTAPSAFTFTFDGETYSMVDPQEVDWQDLLSGLRNPALFVRYAMSIEEQKRFFAKRVPAWKMNKLMEAYTTHFGLPDLGNVNALRT